MIGLYLYDWTISVRLDYICTIGLYLYDWTISVRLDYICMIGLYLYDWTISVRLDYIIVDLIDSDSLIAGKFEFV